MDSERPQYHLPPLPQPPAPSGDAVPAVPPPQQDRSAPLPAALGTPTGAPLPAVAVDTKGKRTGELPFFDSSLPDDVSGVDDLTAPLPPVEPVGPSSPLPSSLPPPPASDSEPQHFALPPLPIPSSVQGGAASVAAPELDSGPPREPWLSSWPPPVATEADNQAEAIGAAVPFAPTNRTGEDIPQIVDDADIVTVHSLTGNETSASTSDELAARATLLWEQGDWPGLAETYAQMVEQAEGENAHELARALAALYRFQLDNPWEAIQVLEHAVLRDGGNAALRFDLGELYLGNGQIDLAIEHVRTGLGMAPTDTMGLRLARNLYAQTGELDREWNMATVLTHLGAADEYELELAGLHRPDGLLPARAALLDEHWQGRQLRPRRHGALERLLGLLASPALDYRLNEFKRAKQLGLPEGCLRQDPNTSTTTLCRSLSWTARLLGVEAPELHIAPGSAATMEAAPAATPTSVVGKVLASGLSLPQLVFLWGRHLTYFRPEHYLLVFYPSFEDLDHLLLAAHLACQWDPRVARNYDPETARLAAHLHRTLGERELGLVRDANAKVPLETWRARAAGFLESVAIMSNRVGLLACGDFQVATEIAQRFPIGNPEAVAEDLIGYCVSDGYLALRTHLGVAVAG